ncbi:DNA repair protein RecN [Crocinitomicaceae bacterium]|nr:DNA repair protein RecN [Crocinitomicaceae bacterium]MDB4324242.1 DNA repair protein RecN [Crocinitomicaceae bacterium]
MISSLRIENFALIDSANIKFDSGFTVITGETGSGKSILLNALNLILGERANFSVIGNKGDKSFVEAELNIAKFGLEEFFTSNELDYFDKTIVRREISKSGRSRAFINDTPVQLSVLKAFSSQLIHIHSQYNTLELKELSFQLKVLDVLANTSEMNLNYQREYAKYVFSKKAINDKKRTLEDSLSQADYNEFQLQELTALHLNDVDYDKTQIEVTKAENSDEIRQGFSSILQVLQGTDSITERITELISSLSKSVEFDSSLSEFKSRLETISVELNDIVDDSEQGARKVEFDPRKLDELISKIDNYNRILVKHRVNSQEELLTVFESLASSSISLTELKNDILNLENSLLVDYEKLSNLADELHQKRSTATNDIQNSIKKELGELKLENTELIFSLSKNTELNTTGISHLEILFSPNIGVDPVPVHQAASGGELSRVMLALQSLMSSKVKLRSMLFDEIDTGVSGDVAQKMGITLSKMGRGMQVIAITHLPQVAAKGTQHLKVIKKIIDGQTLSSVLELSSEERIKETARLMSGDQINDAAIENAKALMQ